MIVVVGAGLAGLVCARTLLRAGHEVCVLEAEESVGGRVRTQVTREGYRLDRGYQTLFASYPALLRHVRLSDLAPRYFASGVEVVVEGQKTVMGHPLYDPGAALKGLVSGAVRPPDLLPLAQMVVSSLALGDAPLPGSSQTTRQYLEGSGLSPHLIERLFVPFFGGISLDRSLASSATFFQLVLRSFVVGRGFVPAWGVGALPALLAGTIPPRSLYLGTRVENLLVDGDRVRGVQTDGGPVAADMVVIATEAPAAAALTGLTTPGGSRSCTTAYFASDRPLYPGRRIVLHAGPSLVNEIAQMSTIAPEYAPPGRHLLAATTLRILDGPEHEVAGAMLRDLQSWFDPAGRVTLDPVGVVRVPYAQFAQPPGVDALLPRPTTSVRGLYLAGEYLHSSSVQGAMRGGEWAAQAVLRDL